MKTTEKTLTAEQLRAMMDTWIAILAEEDPVRCVHELRGMGGPRKFLFWLPTALNGGRWPRFLGIGEGDTPREAWVDLTSRTAGLESTPGQRALMLHLGPIEQTSPA